MKILHTLVVIGTWALVSQATAQEFLLPDGSDLSRAIGEQFVRPMLTLPEQEPIDADFEWLKEDVDGDDYDELFIKLKRDGLCAVGGCPIVGFMRQPDQSWHPILTAVGHTLEFDDGLVVVKSEDEAKSYRFDAELGALVPIETSIESAVPKAP